MHKIMRRAAIAASCITIGAAATLVAAPAASAADSSSCNQSTAKFAYGTWRVNGNNVNLRSGPSVDYSSKGQLSDSTKFRVICSSVHTNNIWIYGTVESGVHVATKGWVEFGYLRCDYGDGCGLVGFLS